MEPLNGINKEVCVAKLQLITASAYLVDYDCLCHLLDTVLLSMSSMEALTHLQPPTHPTTHLYVPFVILQSM